MSLPKATAGLVIRYSYLWENQHLEGLEEGTKDRPCAIILAITNDEGKQRVVVLPVTHSQPSDMDLAVELPAAVKNSLGLDDDRSWVIISESNVFTWPGPDLRRIEDRDDSSIAYGVLPPKFFNSLKQKFVSYIRRTKSKSVQRTQ